ncbi:probable disease resistance protein At1g61300 [Camellia sinensis]|uniref:Uncharacterized protein n=1 Tax=Camellia sinensis var. sinensis TaxID=542762 RepID=A0A4S4DEU5_CAMSN|nr:probable disease resistance protein At1g61300 [Camellia sinensis]THG01222.1 hypothetical protein TEA_014087 [Camellia sinensis var. sinensis]
METLSVVCKAVSAAAQVVQAGSQAKTAFWGSHSSELVLTDNAEDNPRIINDAVGVLLSHVKDSHMMESSEACEEWISQVKDFVAEYNKISKESSFWSPSSLDSRKQRRKMFDKVKELMQKKYEMMIDPSLESVVKSSRAPDISRFRTLQEPLEQTLVLLEDDKTKGICIHGTVGIGKTTILRNLNKHEQVATNFPIVIWLKVSKEESEENFSREHLQQDIVQTLKLNIADPSKFCEVAKKISEELECKRYLLLLDDVKAYLDLREIGIPESNNRSKIVLTTRQLNACTKMVNRVIRVKCLTRVEAWQMFQDVWGQTQLIGDKNTKQAAMELCKGCGGLPLMIEKVANTFKWKVKVANTFKWKVKDVLGVDGLKSWRGWLKIGCEGIRELYELLKQFCYDNLDDDQCKNCFLYGALYPEDTDINKNDLLECWEANNLLFNGNSTTYGNSILDYFHALSILEEGKSMDHVKMDKFIRQVAVYVTEDYPEHRHLVKASKALKQPPYVKLWGEMNRISLGDNELKQLPGSPNCPMLSTLFLQKNLCLKEIDPLFFKNMKKLGVLDLSHTGLDLLPSSISSLDSLKILYLVGCKGLSNLPSDIDGLKQLETLDIRGSAFNDIPVEIVKLSCLRSLRVSFIKSGNENAHSIYDIISKLPKLEELIIDVNSVEELPNEMVDNIIKEVAKLQQFKSLKICLSKKVAVVIEVECSRSLNICSPETAFALYLTENSSWRDAITAFEFYIGCQNSEVSQSPKFLKYDKYIKYCNGASHSFPFPKALAKADAFELVNHQNIKQLSDFGSASMNEVQHLFLKNLPQLESIWKGPGLTKLMTLDLISCQMLVKIFPAGVIQQLHEIQYLKIDKCQEIEEIIAKSDAVGNLNVLPKLKQLILLDMPKLRSVCAIQSLKWGSLEKIEILKCPMLLKLPFNKDNAAKLETIEAEQE